MGVTVPAVVSMRQTFTCCCSLRFKSVTTSLVVGWRGSIDSGAQRVADAVAGQECGLKVQIKDKIEVGDKLELYREEIKERKLGF